MNTIKLLSAVLLLAAGLTAGEPVSFYAEAGNKVLHDTLTGESVANPKPPVILIADPTINLNRVPPPRRFQLRAPKTATITVNFLPAGSPDALWGDVTIAWPAAASAALTYAAGIWESLLNSTVPITINAGWVNNLGSGVLGHSGSVNINRDFSGAPTAGTWYPATLANALAGSDLNPSNPDIYMGFSSTFSWYTGTDGNTPITDYDLVSVVLHEICHGLGFAGSMTVSAGQGSWGNGTGYPISYDRFTEDNSGVSLLNTTTYPNPSVALANALTSGSIFFDGTAANAANGGSRVPLYVPGTWRPGSSYSHLSETYNGSVNSLMTYSLGFGESEHSPGPVTIGLLSDVGWPGGMVVTQTYTLTVQSQNPNTGVAITVSPLDNNSDGNGNTTFTRTYNESTAVTLTAPATAGGNTFDHWKLDGIIQGGSQTLNLTMSNNRTAKAVYTTPAITYTLTVESQNPASGVDIIVLPADNNADGNGTTPFTRVYNAGTGVTLTAPLTAGGNNFDHWELGGVDQGSSVILLITMNSDATATAVYETPLPLTVKKLKGKINWKAGPLYERGNLKVIASVPVGITDLSHLENSFISDLFTIDGGYALPSGTYAGINGKKTVVKYLTVDKNIPISIKTKMKLKDGILYVMFNGKNGFNMPAGFGITNTDTGGWQTKSIAVGLNASANGETIVGAGSQTITYSTKVDKKTAIK